MANIDGTPAGETLNGTVDDDLIRGLGGDDILLGDGGDDQLEGGPGDDSLDGGVGFDMAVYSAAAAGVTVDLGMGSAMDGDGGTDTLVSIEGAIGSAFNDVFTAGAGPNAFNGGAGNDVINGNGFTRIEYTQSMGRVVVDLSSNIVVGDGSVGFDTVTDISGVVGGAGNDIFFGTDNTPAAGFETYEGRAGDDVIDGRGGVDRASYLASPGAVEVDLDAFVARDDGFGGQDSLFGIEQVEGSDFDDDLSGSEDDDTLLGGAGDDVLVGRGGNDVLDGGDDFDVADYSGAGDSVFANLGANTVQDGDGGTDTVTNVEELIGSDFDDELTGGAQGDALFGGLGFDILEGGGGDDDLQGGGDDDTLIGGAGDDMLDGGAGDDVADYSGAGGAITVDLTMNTVQDGEGGTDTLVGNTVERIIGSSFNDVFISISGGDFDGGDGFDTLDLTGLMAATNVDVANGVIMVGGQTLRFTNIEELRGSIFGDTLTGDDGGNSLTGGDGGDTLQGELGADTLDGDAGDDMLLGGADNDTLNGGDGADTLVGGSGDDMIDGGDGDDTIIVDEGDGSDTIVGGTGQDEAQINADDGLGDQFNLSAVGPSAIFARQNLTPFQLDIRETETLQVNAFAGADILQAGMLAGTGVTQVDFNGGDGDDTLDASGSDVDFVADGGDGDDELSSGSGADTLNGGVGADMLDGGGGDDMLSGGDDDDILEGGAGDDTLDGGAGFDQASYQTAGAGIVVDIDAGTAQDGDGGMDTFVGGTIEGVIGSEFDDIFIADVTGIFDGRGGSDTLDYSGFDAAADVDLDAGTVTRGGMQAGSFTDIENVIGSDFDDRLLGNDSDNRLMGGAGDDELRGLLGADMLEGEDGADMLFGGEDDDDLMGGVGDDTLQGDQGADMIDGGAGDDRIIWNNGDGSDTIDGGADQDTVEVNGADGAADNFLLDANGAAANFQRLNLTPFQLDISGTERIEINGLDGDDVLDVDSLAGTPLQDVVFNGGDGDDMLAGEDGDAPVTASGGLGDDQLVGGGGMDDLSGDAGDDTLAGGDDADMLAGGDDSDRLSGDAGDDALNGDAGDDFLAGGAGDDMLDGGAGIDFADYSGAAAGVVVDMDAGTAQDGDGGTDTFVGGTIEGAIGSAFDDRFIADVIGLFEGGGGVDIVDYSGFAAGATVDLDAGTAMQGMNDAGSLLGIENVLASRLDDTISGDDGDNRLFGARGADMLFGRGGQDYLAGNAGDDMLFGGDDDDMLVGSTGDDILEGQRGDDAINGGGGDDRIIWNNGDGSDLVNGAADMDTAEVNGSDGSGDSFILDGAGARATFMRDNLTTFQLDIRDTESIEVNGLAGDDMLDVNDLTGSVLQNVMFDGGDGADMLDGGDATTALIAEGGAGDDILRGGGGVDELRGGDDADRLLGEGGDDMLFGDDGDDRLGGGAGDDMLDGGDGEDLADFSEAAAGVIVDFAAGTAQDGDGGMDTFVGGTIEGVIGSGFDDIFMTDGLGIFMGGAGSDTADFSAFADVAIIDLGAGTAMQGMDPAATLIDIENVIGAGLDDMLTGDGAENTLIGEGGDDILSGAGGNDILRGGAGDDELNGGAGTDAADYSDSGVAIMADLETGEIQDGQGGVDTLNSIEGVIGSAFDDTLMGDATNDLLNGGDGDDMLDGRAGGDTMTGGMGDDMFMVDSVDDRVIEMAGEGDDRVETLVDFTSLGGVETIVSLATLQNVAIVGADDEELIVGSRRVAGGDDIQAGGGNDRIFGLTGNDRIDGGAGADRIFGNSGSDIIIGGAGNDRLTGNFSADTFVHNPGDNNDRITDFDVTEDLLDLTGHDLADFAAVEALMTQVGADTLIDLPRSDSVRLLGVDMDDIGQEDILI